VTIRASFRVSPSSLCSLQQTGNSNCRQSGILIVAHHHAVSGKINSYGWRDKEWSSVKPKNSFRIAVLGDSFVAAFEVESDKTFLALAEQEISRRTNQKVELMNFGVPGFTLNQELLVLRSYAANFSPDMVILVLYPGNDIRDLSKENAREFKRPFCRLAENGELIFDTSFNEMPEFKFARKINWLKQHSAIVSFFSERYNLWRRERRQKIVSILEGKKRMAQGLNGYLSLCTATPDAVYLESYALSKVLIKSMAEFCKEKGIRFMLVTINTEAYIPEVEDEYKSIDPTFDADYFDNDLGKYASSLGIDFLGLQNVFREDYERLGRPLFWSHFNYQGHEVVAQALSNKLEAILSARAE